MIVPALKDEALLADIRAHDRDDGHVRLWWLGQSGFLVQCQRQHLLLDPYLSDSLTRKYENTDKPHVRMTERAVDPAALDFIDVVTSSHNHTDHLDAETLTPILQGQPRVRLVVPAANVAVVCERLGLPRSRPIGIVPGDAVVAGAFRLEAVPAAHEAVTPEYVGYIVRCGPWTLYHSGDTVLYDGMADVLRPRGIHVAMLPINGRAPERRVAGNLDADEAARLGKAIAARTVIPCHYEMFTFNTADVGRFVDGCAAVGQRADVLRCGQRWSSESLADDR